MMLKLSIRAIILALLLVGGVYAKGSVIILDYHTFLGNGKSSLDWSEAEVGEQLDKMTALGYHFVNLEDAIAGKVEGKANIVITIDDGNHSVPHAVKTVFAPRGIKPFLFVYAGIINSRWFAMKTADLQELMALGCGIGAHGYFHEYMTPTAWKKDQAKVMMEVTYSSPMLRKLTGQKPALFAYPFGVGCPEADAALLKEGYEWLFLADTKVIPVSFDDPALVHTAVPRILTFRWFEKQMFKALSDNLK